MIDIHVHLADARCISPGFIAGVIGSMRRLLSQMNVNGIAKSILLIADFGPALGEPALSIENRGNLYSDISSFQLLSHQSLEIMLESCAKVPDQVIFGSDAPLYDLSGNLGAKLEEMRSRLLPAERARLFELNARTFLYGAGR